MTVFWKNKLYTTLVALGLYGGAWWMFGTNKTDFWVMMLWIYMITGYGHFMLGFAYQIRSWFRKTQQPWMNFFKVWGLSLLALIPFVWSLQWATYMMLFIMAYFIWHGALNEKTLYERECKRFNPAFYLIAGILMWWSVNSFGHPSAFFDASYKFSAVLDPTIIEQFWEKFNMTQVQNLALIATLIWGGWMLRKNWAPVLGILIVGGLGYTLFAPFSFIVLLSLILSYHFVTWWIYYAQTMKGRDWRIYMTWSLLVHGLAVLIVGGGYYGWFDIYLVHKAFEVGFAIPVFLAITFLHITTSFFNEDPVKRWLNIT